MVRRRRGRGCTVCRNEWGWAVRADGWIMGMLVAMRQIPGEPTCVCVCVCVCVCMHKY